MKIPEDLKYTNEHEWVQVNGDVATGWSDRLRTISTR